MDQTTSVLRDAHESSRASRGVPRRAIPAVGVVVVLAAVSLSTPGFLTSDNLLNLSQVLPVLGLVTLGQMLVMVGGNLDFSVGATAALSFLLVAEIGPGHGVPLALAVTLASALAIGAVNALLVVGRGVTAFVATLGTSIAINGGMTAITRGVFPGAVPSSIRHLSSWHVGPISGSFLILVLGWLAVLVLLRATTFGRRLYATGHSEKAARYAGIRTGRVRAATFLISSVLAAAAGVLLAAYTGFADATAGQTLHLQSIAAAVVGGVGLFGGRGGVGNAVVGSVLITVVINGAVLHDISAESQPVLIGAVLVVAAVILTFKERTR
ncbi:ABC transporter permease [Streptomyces sp. NPDC002346]